MNVLDKTSQGINLRNLFIFLSAILFSVHFILCAPLKADCEPSVSVVLSGTTESEDLSIYNSPVTISLSKSSVNADCSISCSLDGGEEFIYTEPIEVTSEGNHIVACRLIDSSGNYGSVITADFSIRYLTLCQAKLMPDDTYVGIKDVVTPVFFANDNLILLMDKNKTCGMVAQGLAGFTDYQLVIAGNISTISLERMVVNTRVLSSIKLNEVIRPFSFQGRFIGGADISSRHNPRVQCGDPEGEGPNNIGQYVRLYGNLARTADPNKMILRSCGREVQVDTRGIQTSLTLPRDIIFEGVVRIQEQNGIPKAILRPSRSLQACFPAKKYTCFSDIEYANSGNIPLKLDLYLPDSPGPFPTIVFIHGGSWIVGDKRDSIDAFHALVQSGYAVASINYRYSWQDLYPAQIHDCKAAVRWLRAHAKQYDLDPNLFGAWGPSAGGHLAAMLGTSGDIAELEDLTQGYAAYSSRVQAVVDFFGPTDFLQMDAHVDRVNCQNPVLHDTPGSSTSKLAGCPIQTCPEKVQKANPLAYITPDDPPFLIAHGGWDCAVPVHQSVILFEGLTAQGIPAHLNIVPQAGHGGNLFMAGQPHSKTIQFFDSFLKDKSCVMGFIRDENGLALEDAVVAKSPAGSSCTTQADGHFALFGLIPGTHTFTINKSGFNPAMIEVTTTLRRAEQVNVTLSRSNPPLP